jgi:FlaG/FlaF family flagellin (archaellin)
MFRHRSLRAIASLCLTLSLTITALAASVSAAPPGPKPAPSVTPVPSEVAPGNAGAFDVSFTNGGSSNYAQLFLDADTPDGLTFRGLVAGPTLISPTGDETNLPANSCNSTGDLDCAFGALNAGYTIYVRPLYDTEDDASGSYPVEFIFTSTGTPSDGPGRSHGDDFKDTGSITINADDDFDGGYFAGGTDIGTNPSLTRRNQQSTTIPAFTAFNGGPLTAGEVPLSDFDCPAQVAADGGDCFTQWSVIDVDEATEYTGGFEIIIGLDSTLTSGQVNAIKFVHVKDDGSVELIKDLCNVTTGAAPTNMPCRYFTSDGGDTLVHIWITGNGRLGGY